MNENYTQTMQKVLDTIESDLEYVSIEELISVSGYSYYHFHRIFKAYTGETLNKYIKRLQLEKALLQMQVDKENITQIAMRSGYNTPSAFNKAFKEMFGVNPSQYKQTLMPKRETYKKIEAICEEIIEDIDVYVIRYVGDYAHSYEVWDKLLSFAQKHELFQEDFFAYAIAYDNPDITNSGKLRYDACISRTKSVFDMEDEIVCKKLQGGKYAVFLHHGDHEKLTETYDAIFGYWFYQNEVVLRDTPIFQKFLNNKNEVSESELLTKVYVPID